MSKGLSFDPVKLQSWIGRTVRVFGRSGQHIHVGALLAVDPVSSSVVLKSPVDQSIILVPWIDLEESIQVVEEEKRPSSTHCCLLAARQSEESKVGQRAPEAVVEWLAKHQVQAELQGPVVVVQAGLARLRPPYTTVEASNVIVLDRLTSILGQMPS